MKVKIGDTKTFEQLEKYLNQWENRGKCIVVHDIEDNSFAFMHTFGGKFCGDWRSGDGILFYDNNEQHSALPEREFKILNILSLPWPF